MLTQLFLATIMQAREEIIDESFQQADRTLIPCEGEWQGGREMRRTRAMKMVVVLLLIYFVTMFMLPAAVLS